MNWVLDLVLIVACFLGTALFAGAETAFYRASRVRLEMEAREERKSARLVLRLLADPAGLVVVFVLGLNVCVDVLSSRFEHRLHEIGFSDAAVGLLLALGLVPALFFVAELLPKELCRNRPHAALRLVAPAIAAVRLLMWPLVRLLSIVAGFTARAAGGGAGLAAVAEDREAVLGFLQEGKKSGALPGHSEQMARNVLKLRSTPISRCMVPWPQVTRVGELEPEAEAYARVAASAHTRLLLVGPRGEAQGYLHQLDVLAAGEGVHPREHARPIEALPADLRVDRALARMRAAGARLALVGASGAPQGIVTLKDLLEEISGELPRW